ncbi:hypothetical protein [Massilia sp. DD77]|uniref:hypothetical protein n=1 Tax=Massilia sp. DD77 TaxID=3109349 RepID=UPI002FFFD512
MEFLEYPKALYLSGQALVVDDEEQEDAARANGYDDWHADNERMNTADDAALDRDALKAEAETLGIEFARNISTEKLAALVAEKKAA